VILQHNVYRIIIKLDLSNCLHVDITANLRFLVQPIPYLFVNVIRDSVYCWFQQRDGATDKQTAAYQVTNTKRHCEMHYGETYRLPHHIPLLVAGC